MIRGFLAPALALVLFGRLASAADAPPAAPPSLPVIAAALTGTWQSLNDTKFTREFDTDGRMIDRYEGEQGEDLEGHWALFLGSAPPPGLGGQHFEPKVVYLKVDQNGDVLLFALTGLTRADLRMVYLQRGNVLAFTRLK